MSLTPPELEPIEAPAGAFAAAAFADPPVAEDDGTTLDVLVLYTPGARASAGGTDEAVQARIALGVTETNTGYANSGITPRLRLVGTQLLAYTEAGMNTDLTTLRANASVAALRDATGADLVTLIVANTPEACGLGYLMNSSGFAPYAFNVVAYQCISPNYSFGHELGHNMGSTHAPEDGGSPGYYAYSYGYKQPARLFRTVMAYDCTGGGCPRVLHFSNPGVNYSGAPTGTAAQHNNALSINNNAMTVANFRQAVAGSTAPTISAIGNVTIAEDGATSAIGFTVGDAESSASSLVVTATSSNPALVPNTAAALTFGGSGSSRTLIVTPAANQSGSTTLTVVVSDGGLTASRTFTLTVTPVNDPPVVSRTPATATVAPGVAAQTTVTVTDIDSTGSALALATSSSNTTLLPNPSVSTTVTATTANSRTFQVTMTPAAGLNGAAVVTLNALDGGPAAVTTFTLTVAALAPPVVAPVGAKSTPEDTPIAVGFTVSDGDTPLASVGVVASSSNQAVVPGSGLVISGSGASRTLTITPAANASGSATITLAASDGALTGTTSFVLTVSPVNDAPSFAPGVPAAVSTLIATSTSFPVTVHDLDSAWASLTLAGASTNTAVLANAGIAIVPVSSTATSRTFAVTLTPAGGATGSGGLTLTAGDAQASVNRSVQLSVTATPGAPDPPTTLTASATGTTLHLSWTAASTGSTATSFAVAVGTAPGTTTLPVQTTTAAAFDVVVPSSGVYYARVSAVNTFGTSLPSPEAEVTIAAAGGRPGRTPRPRAWTSGRSLGMEWDAPIGGDPVNNFALEVGTAPGLTDLLTLPLGVGRSFSSGVPNGTFWLRVRGANDLGVGDPSEDIGLVMGPAGGCVGLPFAPALLSAAVTGPVVALSWGAPSGGVAPTGYVIHAGVAPGRTDLVAFNTGSTLTGWSGAAPPGTYYVRVAARTACGEGPLSNEVAVSVGTAAPPEVPGLLSAAVTGRVVSLTWSAPSSGAPPSSYLLEVGSTSGASNVAAFDTGGAATSIAGSVAPGRYHIRVRARVGAATGPASNEVVVDVP